MGSRINVIMPLGTLMEIIHDLAEKYGIQIYVERRDEALARNYVALKGDVSAMKLAINEGYRQFFFSAIEVPLNEKTSFYADGIFDYCIEGKGGHEMGDDIEMITLRIISKNPDKTIQSFFGAVNNRLKKAGDVGVGVYTGAGSFYKNIFYLKSLVGKKEMWFDFERKNTPITVAE